MKQTLFALTLFAFFITTGCSDTESSIAPSKTSFISPPEKISVEQLLDEIKDTRIQNAILKFKNKNFDLFHDKLILYIKDRSGVREKKTDCSLGSQEFYDFLQIISFNFN